MILPILVYCKVPLIRRVCKVPGDTLSNFFTSSDLSHFFGGSAAIFKIVLSSATSSDLN